MKEWVSVLRAAELVDVRPVLVRPEAADLAGAVGVDDDVLRHGVLARSTIGETV
jgi:hypothetical protein